MAFTVSEPQRPFNMSGALPAGGLLRISGLCKAIAGLLLFTGSVYSQSADSLPAFKPDSAVQDPFRKVEAGPSPWSSRPADTGSIRPMSRSDSLAQKDSVTARLRHRHPAVSVYVGIDFIDLDAKEALGSVVAARVQKDSLKILQGYDPVHLAFPLGFQAIYPVGAYLDLVVKTHSYWYKQTAVLGDKASNHVGDEWFAVQANLGGAGLRYYVPPSLLSVTGGLGLYAQGVLFWNLGNSEMYTPYGSAPARFDPFGSGYEFQFGIQQTLSGPWLLSGAIGFLHQDFKSGHSWSHIMILNPPAGEAHWASSAIQASLNLWYHFGVPKDTLTAKTAAPPGAYPAPAPSASNPPVSPPAPALPIAPAPAPAAIQPDSTRRK